MYHENMNVLVLWVFSGCGRAHCHTLVLRGAPKEYGMIYRELGSRRRMIWLLPPLPFHPSTAAVSNLSLFLSLSACRRSSLLMGGGGGGG